MGTQLPPSALTSALLGKTRGAVLALLFGHPDQRFHLRAIVRTAGAGVGAIQRELAALSGAGIVRRTEEGRQVYFQVEPSCPIYPELSGIVAKTVGLAHVLSGALDVLARRIRVALVYGSGARGALTAASDVDVLVIGAAPFAQVVDALRPAQERLNREVNPSVFTAAEWAQRLQAGEHFATRVSEGPKLFLVGDAGELDRVAGERMAARASDQPLRDRQAARRRRPRSG